MKYYFALLQTGRTHADHPDVPEIGLKAERRLALDPPGLERRHPQAYRALKQARPADQKGRWTKRRISPKRSIANTP